MVDDDDDDQGYEQLFTDEFPLDPVASRCESFTRLLATVDTIQNEDARKEALLMLRAVRLSFKTLPVGDLTSITGGKTN
jgi:hypothetical protein